MNDFVADLTLYGTLTNLKLYFSLNLLVY